MGDRRTAEIRLEKGSLYVYSHWGGFEMREDAQDAIRAAEGRWSDEPYAARIIVDQLTKHSRDQETGHGLMLGPDAEDEYGANPSVIIDLVKQELHTVNNGVMEGMTFQEAREDSLGRAEAQEE